MLALLSAPLLLKLVLNPRSAVTDERAAGQPESTLHGEITLALACVPVVPAVIQGPRQVHEYPPASV